MHRREVALLQQVIFGSAYLGVVVCLGAENIYRKSNLITIAQNRGKIAASPCNAGKKSFTVEEVVECGINRITHFKESENTPTTRFGKGTAKKRFDVLTL